MRIATKTALAFAAFAALCVGGSGLLLIDEFEDGLFEALRDRQRLLVSNRALVLRENLALASGEIERVAAMAEIDLEDEDLGPEQRLMAQAYQQTSFFNRQMELYGAHGRCRWAEPHDGGRVGVDASREAWFIAASRAPYETRVYTEGTDEGGLVDLVTPVTRDGRVVGVLRGVVDLHGDLMFSPALHDDLQPSTRVALLTDSGRAMLRSEGPEIAPAERAVALRALSTDQAGAVVMDVDGEPRVVAWAPVGRADLGLVFSWPLHELDESAERHLRSLTLSMSVVGALALLTGFVVARLLTGPLQRLAAQVRGVHTRSLERLPRTERRDEIGDVQRALRALLEMLDAREVEITEDRDRIAELATQLEERVEERTAELREAQDALVQAERLAAIGRAGTVLGHEIRNTLNAVSVAMDTLGTDADRDEHETARRLVRGEITRMRKLSDELIDYAREPALERVMTPVADLFEIAGLLVEDHAREHGVQVELDLEGEPRASVDPDRMHTALVNLLRNAVDAAAGGAAPRVRATARSDDGRVRILVDDTGAGVAESIRERLFQPFVTSRRQGLGLGLAIADRLVRAHGGTIELDASPLGGARFVVTIPVEDPAAHLAAEEAT
ncbi:MAG: hypothetical protein H6719_18875 [Sandaracinaceae bacterium]|nr:hypothetical protein [Sandaracinaceae bacterium]